MASSLIEDESLMQRPFGFNDEDGERKRTKAKQ